MNSNLSIGKPGGYSDYRAAPMILGPWRFSSTARYAAAFTPAKAWSVDPSTVTQFFVQGGLVGGAITDEAGGDNSGTGSGFAAANDAFDCSP